MTLWLCLLAALAGTLSSVQAGANSQLGRIIGNPFGVAAVSLSISVLFALAALFFAPGSDLTGFRRMTQAPWWAWTGGFCGAIFVLSQPLVAHRLGAAVYISLTVTASAIASVLLDHYGLMGFQQHTASIWRIAGAALMIAGVSLIAKF